MSQILKSPGYYDREVDQSVREQQPLGIPTAIIGGSLKGPAFVPSKLGSYPDFEAKYGPLDQRFSATYAMDAVLASKPAATFLRVLGAGANTTAVHFEDTRVTGRVQSAGFYLTGSAAHAFDARSKGAVQFIAAKHKVSDEEFYGYPMFTNNDSYTLGAGSEVHLVRAMVFMAEDTRMMVMDHGETFSPLLDDSATVDDTSTAPIYRTFKLVISSSAGTTFASDDNKPGLKIYTASFDPSSQTYIGKILNTDPEKISTYKHVLYLDFPVDQEIAAVRSGSGNENAVVVFSGSSVTSKTSGDTSVSFKNAFGSFNTRYKSPKTPMFISQPFGTQEFDLFNIEAIDDGDYANEQHKISIANIKTSTDPMNEYGTFTVLVRKFTDTDLEPVVVEQFNNLSINPEADNYVAKVIGDKKISYLFDAEDETDRKLIVSGKYPNKSKHVRVVMSDGVTNKRVPAKALPFGFAGPELLLTNPNSTDSPPTIAYTKLYASGAGTWDARLSGSIVPPVPFRFKVTRGEVSDFSVFIGEPGSREVVDSRLFWGVKFERNNTAANTNVTSEQNGIISAFTKFAGLRLLDVLVTGSYANTFNNNKFTLARVAFSNLTLASLTGSAQMLMKNAAYIRNGSPDGTNSMITETGYGTRVTLATVLNKDTAASFNRFSDYAKFTTFMYGGFDGINIFDKNAKRFNDKSTSTETSGLANSSYVSPGFGTNFGGSGNSNNHINSFKVAANILCDPITAEHNILGVPGQREPLVTDYISLKNNEYGLAFYPQDIPVYDADGTRLYDNESGVPDVTQTSTTFDSRTIDDSSSAAYFPNIVIEDRVNNRRVIVPASVAAIAAYAYNDKVAYPWYAPAGFNRAALRFVFGSAVRINATDKDTLINARINPIVKFPRDGFLLSTQRTLLQANTPRASINIKRMVLDVKKIVNDIAGSMLFEQITETLINAFDAQVKNALSTVQLQKGIESFSVQTTYNKNEQSSHTRIVIFPTNAAEFVSLDFVLVNGIATLTE
jgi:hypothetical protein